MIEVPEKFGLYIRQLNEEIDKDPVNFVPKPSYIHHNKPYNEWTEEQKRKMREHVKQWRKNNPEKAALIQRRWNLKNPEKVKAYQRKSSRKYYLSHKEQILEYQREKHRRSRI